MIGPTGADLDAFVRDSEGLNEIDVGKAVLAAQAEIQGRHETFSHVSNFRQQDDGPADLLDAMSSAIVHRLRPDIAPSERGREYLGLDLPDIGRELLRAGNVNIQGMSRNRVVETALATRGYHTTSDFTVVLGNATNTVLRRDYQAQQAPIRAVFNRNVVENFRKIRKAQIGRFPDLLPANEHGEFRRGTVVEEGQNGYRLGTFGRIFGATRQLFVNDQVGPSIESSAPPSRPPAISRTRSSSA